MRRGKGLQLLRCARRRILALGVLLLLGLQVLPAALGHDGDQQDNEEGDHGLAVLLPENAQPVLERQHRGGLVDRDEIAVITGGLGSGGSGRRGHGAMVGK
jgi:hypothetical protein